MNKKSDRKVAWKRDATESTQTLALFEFVALQLWPIVSVVGFTLCPRDERLAPDNGMVCMRHGGHVIVVRTVLGGAVSCDVC